MLAYAWVLFSTSLIWLSFYVKLICQTQKLFKLCVYTLLFLKKVIDLHRNEAQACVPKFAALGDEERCHIDMEHQWRLQSSARATAHQLRKVL